MPRLTGTPETLQKTAPCLICTKGCQVRHESNRLCITCSGCAHNKCLKLERAKLWLCDGCLNRTVLSASKQASQLIDLTDA